MALGVIFMCQCRFIYCNKRITMLHDVNSGHKMVWGPQAFSDVSGRWEPRVFQDTLTQENFLWAVACGGSSGRPGRGRWPEAGIKGLRGGRGGRRMGTGRQASWLCRAQTGGRGMFLPGAAPPCQTLAWYSGPLPDKTSRSSGPAPTSH